MINITYTQVLIFYTPENILGVKFPVENTNILPSLKGFGKRFPHLGVYSVC